MRVGAPIPQSGTGRQHHLFFFVPLPSLRQSRCQPDDKHPVTRHYKERIVPDPGRWWVREIARGRQ